MTLTDQSSRYTVEPEAAGMVIDLACELGARIVPGSRSQVAFERALTQLIGAGRAVLRHQRESASL